MLKVLKGGDGDRIKILKKEEGVPVMLNYALNGEYPWYISEDQTHLISQYNQWGI